MSHASPNSNHLAYRPDIDGLRTIAILAVVFFHAFPKAIPGGFIGVDIFFVISGYLISSIIFSNLENEIFSIRGFYVRRIKRIFPALILVLLTVLVVGWYYLFNEEFKQLCKHAAAGAGFIQNFTLLREGGYFDNDATTKPLLHLWSLAIEEQFYIFWPLLLAFVWRNKWSFLKITAVIGAISFLINIYLVQRSPAADFYLPLSRFWELMMGGVIAYQSLHLPETFQGGKNLRSVSGFFLIFLGLIFLSDGSNFPGYWALIPVVGAALVISAGQDAWLNKKFLANKVMVWMGLISYPLYLWHWPILSFLRILKGHVVAIDTVGAVLVSVFLSWLTFVFIERPFRSAQNINRKIQMLLIGMLAIAIFGMAGFHKNGFAKIDRIESSRNAYLSYFENSLPDWKYFERTDMQQKFRADCDFYDIDQYRKNHATLVPRASIATSCYTRNTYQDHAVFIWGDSHAQMLVDGLANNLPENWQILLGVSSGCAPDPDVKRASSTNYCEQSNWFALATISHTKPDVVIVAQNEDHSFDRMKQITKKLKMMGIKRIIFTGPSPHWKQDLPKLVVRNFWEEKTKQRTWFGINQDVIDKNKELKERFSSGLKGDPEVVFVSLTDVLCNDEGCLIYLGSDRKLGITSWDYGHLTPIASDWLAKTTLVEKIISPNKDTRGNQGKSSAEQIITFP